MLLYQGGENTTMLDAYQEARLLAEALAQVGLGFPNEPRNRRGTVTFNYRDNGDLESIFVATKIQPAEG